MTMNAETPRRLSGAFQEDSAAGGRRTATVAQLRRRRDAASRCESFECGHRDPLDCAAAGCGEQTDDQSASPAPEPAAVEPGDFAQLWADARIAFFAEDFPKYGGREWQALDPDDPKRLASALHAAEMWRRYGDEEELCGWLKRLSHSPEAVLRARAIAELDALAAPKPPHQLQATPGWPPIRIPGKPGRYLTYTEGRAAA
ncbi:hypothetical protein [Streptomyces sp. NPDC001978]|uniref:hypothetical protein n=1 Tax=Streptomyces sp. NPDC001978 TaxID=3364627 RepID=UPI0036BD53B1